MKKMIVEFYVKNDNGDYILINNKRINNKPYSLKLINKINNNNNIIMQYLVF